ncbi:MAG: biopolymer transporter ExbD [Cellvibrionaceae bacterium]|nr:biopolymer transporter ExbD [Cellvibrionaceae bacterium]
MDIVESLTPKKYDVILPLVNIVFLLLIFFMLAGAFNQVDPFAVDIPYAQSKKLADPNLLTVIMSADRQFAIDNTVYSEKDIIALLAEKITENNRVQVQLKADQALKARDLIAIMEKLGNTGLKSLHLLTQSSH